MLIEDIEKYVIERTEAFKKELNKEVKQMIKEDNQGQVKSIWDLKIEDKEEYYRLYGDGDIAKLSFNADYDENVREVGNAFLTRKEAEFEKERRKIEAVMRKYSRPFKINRNNYGLYFHDSKSIYVGTLWAFNSGIPCFETKEIAQKVIDEIGESKLKKYWFRVEE